MNIGLFTRSLSTGGAEKVMASLSVILPDKYNKTIFLYDTKRIDYQYVGEIISLESYPKRTMISKIFAFIDRVYKLKRFIEEFSIDVTISFLDSPNLVNIFTKMVFRRKKKCIVSIRNYKSIQNKNMYMIISKLAIKSFYKNADKIVVVSKVIKEDLISNYGIDKCKISVIYNPYNITLISKLANEKIEPIYEKVFRNPTIINVGRLNVQKGQKFLIKIISLIKKDIPNIQLVILGEGELEENLKNMATELGVLDSVHFWGFQKNPYKYMKKSDIFAFPSLHEGFPNALVEAMACATPVISADCKSGPREILAPSTDIFKKTRTPERAEYGVLMPVIEENNEEIIDLWANEIKLMLNDNKVLKQYSDLCIERVREFSVDETIKQWIRVIEG